MFILAPDEPLMVFILLQFSPMTTPACIGRPQVRNHSATVQEITET